MEEKVVIKNKLPKKESLIAKGFKDFWRSDAINGIKKHKFLYLLTLPAIILLIVFSYAPMFGIIVAFQEYVTEEGVLGSEFIGFENFYDILFNPGYHEKYGPIRNTVYIAIVRIATNFPLILVFTLMVNEIKCRPAKSVVQAISYIPYYISWVAVGGMAYNLFEPSGIFNQIISLFGGTPIEWYKEPDYWWGILAISSLWKGMGWSTLIYLSALSAIDTELYDACEIDGGGRFRKMLSVTLPGIMNVIMLQLILDIAGIMSDNYDQVMAMTNGAGLLKPTTNIIGAVEFGALGKDKSGQSTAAAYGLLRGGIGLILVLVTNKIAKNSGNEGIM